MKAILLALALVGCALAMPVDVPLVITDYSSVVESKNLVPVAKIAEPAPVKEIAVESVPVVEAAADSPAESLPLAPVPAVVEPISAETATVQDPLVETPLKEVAELVKEEEIKPLMSESEETKLEEPIPEASQPLETIKDAVPESIPVFVEAVPVVLAHDLPAAEEKPIAAETVLEEIKATELPTEEAAATAAPIVEDVKVADASFVDEIKVADAPAEEVKVIEAPVEEVKVAEVIPEEVKVADAPVEDVKVSEVVVEDVKVVAPIADEASSAEVISTLVDTPEEKPAEIKPFEASAEEIKDVVLADTAPEADKLAPQESEIVELMDAKPEVIPVAVIADSKPVEIPVVETVVEVEPVVAADEKVESKPEEIAELIVEKAEEKPEEKPAEKPIEEAVVADEKVVELKPEETVAVEFVEKKPEVLAMSDEAMEPAAAQPEAEKVEVTTVESEEAKITAAPLEESSEALKLDAASEKLEAAVTRRRRGLEGKLDEIKKPTGANKKDDSYIKGEKKPKSEDIKVAVVETVVAEEAVPFADTPAVEEVVPVVVAVEKEDSHAEGIKSSS